MFIGIYLNDINIYLIFNKFFIVTRKNKCTLLKDGTAISKMYFQTHKANDGVKVTFETT